MHRPRLNAHSRTASRNVTRAAAIAAVVLLASATPLDAVQPTVPTLIRVGTANGFRAIGSSGWPTVRSSNIPVVRRRDQGRRQPGSSRQLRPGRRERADRVVDDDDPAEDPRGRGRRSAGRPRRRGRRHRAGHGPEACPRGVRRPGYAGWVDQRVGRLLVAGLAHPGQVASARSVAADRRSSPRRPSRRRPRTPSNARASARSTTSSRATAARPPTWST